MFLPCVLSALHCALPCQFEVLLCALFFFCLPASSCCPLACSLLLLLLLLCVCCLCHCLSAPVCALLPAVCGPKPLTIIVFGFSTLAFFRCLLASFFFFFLAAVRCLKRSYLLLLIPPFNPHTPPERSADGPLSASAAFNRSLLVNLLDLCMPHSQLTLSECVCVCAVLVYVCMCVYCVCSLK